MSGTVKEGAHAETETLAGGSAPAGEEPDAWTPERRRAFREALAKRRQRQLRASQLFAVLLLATVSAGVLLRVSPSWWMPAVGGIALLGVVFRLANWKCPNCGERLPSRRPSAICLGCGAPTESL